MKKLSLIICTIFLGQGLVHSQPILRGGVNLANITITNDGDIDENKMLTSFQVGLLTDIKLATGFYFQPGILFTGKGSKTSGGNPSGDNYFTATTNPFYAEIPATFLFKSPTGAVKLIAGAGPYLGIGIAGKNKVDGKLLGNSFHSEKNIEWSNDDPSTLNYEEGAGYGILKRFDYGLNGTVGLELPNTIISVNYGFGLAKLQSGSNSSADDKNKHRVLSLTVGIKL